MLSPLVIILLVIYVLTMYNAMVNYEKASSSLLKTVQEAEEQQSLRKKNQGQQATIAVKEVKHQEAKQPAAATAKAAKAINETLVLTTKHGNIRIVLRPDLSAGSVDYIHRLVESEVCRRCNFYRAEKPGILQGVIANKDVGFNTERGSCPPGAESVENECPKWDPDCKCHGPLMTKGMVAWAAGQAGGPDFFIDNYETPAMFWGTQHTNFGQIQDEESFRVVDYIFELPIHKNGGMTLLEDAIAFELSIE